MTRKTLFRLQLLALAAASVFTLAIGGCTTEDVIPPPVLYLSQTSEANVLNNLQVAYRRREIERYSEILAEDFQFQFDESTRQEQGLPVFWTRLEDSLNTGNLFAASNVTDIRIELIFGNPRGVNEIGRESWTQVDVLDTFLEVDQAPQPGEPEGTTFRVDGQLQQFFFRQGRNAADTDTATSETAKLFYLVEWRDFGFGGSKPGRRLGAVTTLDSPTRNHKNVSWGELKNR